MKGKQICQKNINKMKWKGKANKTNSLRIDEYGKILLSQR